MSPSRFALALALCAACQPARRVEPVTVALMASGDEQLAQRWPAQIDARSLRAVRLRRAELATPVDEQRPAQDAAMAAIAQAGPLFGAADFARCSHAFDAVSIDQLFAEGRRDLAPRALLWTAACALADERPDDARSAADRIASAELEVPSVVTRPDVEALVADALARAAAQPRRPLTVRASVAGALVDVDGRPAICATPCAIELRSGPHVLVLRRDRYEPAVATVTVRAQPLTSDVALSPASAARASAQWSDRARRGAPADSAESMALLSLATSAPRVVLVQSERERAGLRLRAALAVDGVVAARSELRASASPTPIEGATLLRELLVRGRVVEPERPVIESPWFWVAVGSAAIAGAAVTTWVFTRPVETSIGFDGR
jgi:hypothetical protein